MSEGQGSWLQRVRQRPWRVLGPLGVLLLTAVPSPFVWAEYHLRAARQAFGHYDFAEACGHFDCALEVWRWNAPVHLEAAAAARRGERYEDAGRHLADAERLQPGRSDEVLRERTLLRVQRGDLSDRDEQYIRQRADQNGTNAALLLEAVARGHLANRRFQTTQHCADECLQRQPDDVPALFAKGEARAELTAAATDLPPVKRCPGRPPKSATATGNGTDAEPSATA